MSDIDTSTHAAASLAGWLLHGCGVRVAAETLEALAKDRDALAKELADAIAAIETQGKVIEAYLAQVEALTQSRKEHAVALADAIFALTDLRATLSAAEAREARLRAELLTVANAMPHTWIQSRALATLANTEATP